MLQPKQIYLLCEHFQKVIQCPNSLQAQFLNMSPDNQHTVLYFETAVFINETARTPANQDAQKEDPGKACWYIIDV